MSWVEVRRARGTRQWQVGISSRRPESSTEVEVEVDDGRLDTRVEATISRVIEGIDEPLWQLEIGKQATQVRPELLGAAFRLVDAARAARGSAARAARGEQEARLAMQVDDAATVAHITARELARGGARVGGVARSRALAGCRLFSASLIAFAIHLALVLRYAPSSRVVPSNKRLVFAIHGERSNRTRQLLPPRFDPGTEPVFVLLGRPRTPLEAIARRLDPDGRMPGMTLVRPTSLGAALRSLPNALRRLAAGFAVLRDTPVTVSTRDLIAMAFRFFLGASQAAWWRQAGLTPEVVAFGHTGIADTTALEQAMQAQGSTTVHCVHGLSLGWNFAAYSDIGLFASGRDAELARRWGYYRKATSIASPMPASTSGDGRWLVLTAYSHPMSPAYATRGLGPDLEVLHAIADAARDLGQDPSRVVWRPHPAIDLIAAADRAELRSAAADLGFTPWPEDLPYEEAAKFSIVATTPSTAATDLLRHGRLPVIVVTAPLQADTVYDSFPFVARSRQQVCELLGRFEETPETESHFRTAWDAVRPGGALTVEAILQAVKDLRCNP